MRTLLIFLLPSMAMAQSVQQSYDLGYMDGACQIYKSLENEIEFTYRVRADLEPTWGWVSVARENICSDADTTAEDYPDFKGRTPIQKL